MMNLLPKTREDFQQTEYWNSFFQKRGEKTFEWYGEYLELCEQIHKYIKLTDSVLMLGCGNSKLSEDMYDAGFRHITNIDTSLVAIKNKRSANAQKRPEMKSLQMDAMEMSFEDEQFFVAMDKATLDALFVDDSEAVKESIKKYFTEILRVLRIGGRYLCITLLQEHILRYIIEFFSVNSCMIRVVHCADRTPDSEDGITLPVFVVVVTKFKSLPIPILEFGVSTEKMQRIEQSEQLVGAVTAIQKAALICSGLTRHNIAGHNEVTLDLYRLGQPEPRYTVHILDQPAARGLGRFGVFLVPQGREVEWLFSTPAGRKRLLETAKFQRLAIVSLHRDHNYESLENVKLELADSMRNLAPAGIKEQIPYLALGSDVGKRETLVTGNSKWSGDYLVEEVARSDGKFLRRLIFLKNQFVVQSEALVKIVKVKRKKDRKRIEIGYLACEHHKFMSVGAQLATSTPASTTPTNVLVVGLGGGGLCTFLHAALPKSRITAVEIDPIMLEIAEHYFELKQDERLHVVVDDGLAFLERCRKEAICFNAILFDVDSKDLSLGMSCPPKSFLEPNVLENVRELIVEGGLFVLNLVCRDVELRAEAVAALRKSFAAVCCYKLEEDVNEVVYCSNDERLKSIDCWKTQLKASLDELQASIKKQKISDDNEVLDISDFLEDLEI